MWKWLIKHYARRASAEGGENVVQDPGQKDPTKIAMAIPNEITTRIDPTAI